MACVFTSPSIEMFFRNRLTSPHATLVRIACVSTSYSIARACVFTSRFTSSLIIFTLVYMLPKQLYFYTATIHQWKPLLKDLALEPVIIQSLSYLYHKECIKVYGFVIMPNHIHLIWELLQNNGKESPAASFMKFTAHKFQEIIKQNVPEILPQYKVDWDSRSYNFWHPKADWFLLNQSATIEQKLNYIHLNPMKGKWNLVADPSDYYYSSCRFYEQGINDFDFLNDYRDWCG
jgi:REP element-mobilizing transposase RayT